MKEERQPWKGKINFLLNDLKAQKEVEEKILGEEE